jgi:hypothetical protein
MPSDQYPHEQQTISSSLNFLLCFTPPHPRKSQLDGLFTKQVMALAMIAGLLFESNYLQAQCASMPSGIDDCLRSQQAFVAIGNPNALTDLSDWITSSCILPLSSAYNDPQYIVIVGDIQVDVDYNFAPGSEVLIMPGKQIRQLPNTSFGIFDSYIHGCEEMWLGWRLESDSITGSAALQIKDSEFEDAIHGFRLTPLSFFGAQNTVFANNYISIRTDFWDCDNIFFATWNTRADYYSIAGICDNVFTAPSLLPPFNPNRALGNS